MRRHLDECQAQRKHENMIWRPSTQICTCDSDTAITPSVKHRSDYSSSASKRMRKFVRMLYSRRYLAPRWQECSGARHGRAYVKNGGLDTTNWMEQLPNFKRTPPTGDMCVHVAVLSCGESCAMDMSLIMACVVNANKWRNISFAKHQHMTFAWFLTLMSVTANNLCTERSLLDDTVEGFQNCVFRTAFLVNKRTWYSCVLETHQQRRLQSLRQSDGAVVTNLVASEADRGDCANFSL